MKIKKLQNKSAKAKQNPSLIESFWDKIGPIKRTKRKSGGSLLPDIRQELEDFMSIIEWKSVGKYTCYLNINLLILLINSSLTKVI